MRVVLEGGSSIDGGADDSTALVNWVGWTGGEAVIVGLEMKE